MYTYICTHTYTYVRGWFGGVWWVVCGVWCGGSGRVVKRGTGGPLANPMPPPIEDHPGPDRGRTPLPCPPDLNKHIPLGPPVWGGGALGKGGGGRGINCQGMDRPEMICPQTRRQEASPITLACSPYGVPAEGRGPEWSRGGETQEQRRPFFKGFNPLRERSQLPRFLTYNPPPPPQDCVRAIPSLSPNNDAPYWLKSVRETTGGRNKGAQNPALGTRVEVRTGGHTGTSGKCVRASYALMEKKLNGPTHRDPSLSAPPSGNPHPANATSSHCHVSTLNNLGFF